MLLRTVCTALTFSACLVHTASAEKVVIGIPVTPMSVQWAHLSFAEEIGIFADENIEVEYSNVNGTAVLLPQVATGQVDFGLANPDLTLVAAAKGEPLPITFVMNWLRSHGYEFVVNENSPVQTIADLKGKKIGVGGLTWGNIPMTRGMLSGAGVDWSSDIEVFPVGIGPAAWRQLETGEVDMLNLFISQHAMMELAGIKLRRLELPAEYKAIFSNGIAARNELVSENPDLVARFGRALAKSWVACKANVEACVRAHWKRYPAEMPEAAKEAEQLSIDMKRAMFDGVMIDDFAGGEVKYGSYSDEAWKTYVEVMAGAEQIETADFDVTKLYTNQFVDAINDFDHAAVEEAARNAK
jgi:NitT/TauT family transport system substrate-binding protein